MFNNVAGYQDIAAAFHADVEVHVLDASQDGLARMAGILQGRQGIEGVHVVGHGSPGALNLGSLALDSGNLAAHADELAAIGAALAPDGDILLYGCDVAAGTSGAQFVGQIARATGADVAASSDATGAAPLGGNWALEYATGPVAAAGAFDAAALHGLNALLALPTGVQDVTSSMNEVGKGSFVPGFTLYSADFDFVTNDDPLGIYLSVADDVPRDATFTISADNSMVGSFDLTAVGWQKYSPDGAFDFKITGYRNGAPVGTVTMSTANGSMAYSPSNFSGLTNINYFTVEMITTSPPQEGIPLGQNTLDSFTIANAKAPNVAPSFLSGANLLTPLAGQAVDVKPLLHASDPDGGQTLTWTMISGPAHGTLNMAGATAASGSGDITPGGAITYQAAGNWAGIDAFTVLVSDANGGTAMRTITVKPLAPNAPDLATASDLGASPMDNLTSAPSVVFNGTGATGGGIGAITVTTFIDKNNNGVYDAGTDPSGTATMSNGAWTSPSLSTSGLNGNYNVYAQVFDGATGSALSPAGMLVVDTIAPTVSVASSKATLLVNETATITFTFSEDPGTSFTAADLTVSGGSLSGLSTTGFVRTATFTPDGTQASGSVQVHASGYADAAGNNGAGGSSPTITIVLDSTPPAAPSTPALAAGSDTGASPTDHLTKVTRPTLQGTAEAGATVKLYDGATLVGSGTADGSGNWTIQTSTLAQGAHSISAVATDAANNVGPASAALDFTIDTMAPTVTISSSVATLKIGEKADITFTFSEDPGTTFDASDIVVSGGTLGTLSGSGITRHAEFTPTANTDAAVASITVAQNGYEDTAGNMGGAGVTPALTFDTRAPTLTIGSDMSTLKAGETATISFTFSEDPGAAFTLAAVASSGGTLSNLAGSGVHRSATFTPDAGASGTASVSVASHLYHDLAGNQGGNAASVDIPFNTVVPSVLVTSDTAALKIGEKANITFTFSEDPGASFDASDIVVGGGTLGTLSGSGVTRHAEFTPTANTDATVASITVVQNSYTNTAGNPGAAGATPSLTFDTRAPTLAIGSDKTTLKAGETATISFTFSEDPGPGFTLADVASSGGVPSNLTGSGTHYSATFTPDANATGTASVSVWSNLYHDLAGNEGDNSATVNIPFNTVAPSVLITSDKAALKGGEKAAITFTFSEDPGTSFALTDVSVQGGTLANLAGTGLVRTAEFTPSANTDGGTASITVAAGSYTNPIGNGGTAGLTPSLHFDTRAPDAPSIDPLGALDDTGTDHTDGITNLADLTVTGSAEANASIVLLDGGQQIRTVVADNQGHWSAALTALAEGTHTFTAVATDAAGNESVASAHRDITVDQTPPTLTITSDKATLVAGQTATITFTFSQDPGTSFAWDGSSGDATVSGGTLSAISGTGTTRTAVFTPDANVNAGTAGISVAAGSYTDIAGNAGGPGVTPSITFDTLPPTVTIASDKPTLAIGDTATITFTFSEDPGSTFAWDGTSGDVAVSGGTLSAIDGSGTTRTAVFTPSADTNGGAASITVAGGSYADAAGNGGAGGPTPGLAFDTRAPDAPSTPVLDAASDSGASHTDKLTNIATPTFTGTAEANATVRLYDGATLVGSGTADGAGNWSFATNALGGGVHAIKAVAVDAAGNAGAASAAQQVTIDLTAPAAPVLKPSGGAMIVTGLETGATWEYSLDGGAQWQAGSGDRFTVPAGATKVPRARQTDAAGNTGAAGTPPLDQEPVGLTSTIWISDRQLAAGETAVVKIDFSEAVRTFPLAALSVQNGKLSDLATSNGGLSWTANLSPAAGVDDNTNVITLDNTALVTAQGQHGTGMSTSGNYRVATIRPTASLSVGDHILSAGASTTITVKFSEKVSGFDGADVALSHATLSNLATSDGGATWTATVTAETGLKVAAPGAITIDAAGVVDADGNAGQGNAAVPIVVVPANATFSAVDGTPVLKQTVTDAGGAAQQVVTVPQVAPGRVDDPATSNHGMADIPLAPNLTVSLPSGAGLQASGPAAPLAPADAQGDLLARIDAMTAPPTTPGAGPNPTPGTTTPTGMIGHVQDYFTSLGAGTNVQVESIVPLLDAGAPVGQPIVIAGAQPGDPNAPATGLMIDGRALPAGTTLQLDNVDFAAVFGDLRLIGGQGRNVVVGDGGSQTIYLGADDDVLDGGAGDDRVGSAGGDDRLNGGAGNDLVAGGIGNDRVSGDAGDDVVLGGRSSAGVWTFHVSAAGAIGATHDGAVFSATGSEKVAGAELDASTPELAFLKADPQKVAGIALLYAALDRAPDLAGLSYWATSGATLRDVAKGVLASAEFGGSALGQTDDATFIAGMYEHVLGRAPDPSGLAYWGARLKGSDGLPAASRADVLVAVALSDEHKAHATGADGITVGQAGVLREAAWFAGSGDDLLDGGAGSDLLVGGDGNDTAVYAGNRAQYRVLVGADGTIRVQDTANGDLDTLSGIESARFGDGAIDIGYLATNAAQAQRVGLVFEAVLDRAADAGGLKWWSSLNLDTAHLAQAITATAEFQARYAGMNDAAFVKALYANSGLDAQAAGGAQSWQDYLGHHTRAELVAAWIGQDDVVHAQYGANGLWVM